MRGVTEAEYKIGSGAGGLNSLPSVYFYLDELDPTGRSMGTEVRFAQHDAMLVPENGDKINGTIGWMGERIQTVVTEVKQFGDGCVAFEVRLKEVVPDVQG